MSDNLDIDPELSALRNELLTSLTVNSTFNLKDLVKKNKILIFKKKNVNKKLPNNECVKEASNEDDYELELLRREALNAKRAKTEAIKKNYIPGRFRYDKESEDEEEDDEEDLNFKKSSVDYDDDNEINLDNEYTPFHLTKACVTGDDNNKSLEYCNFQSNYQSYRAEISKIMPNDEYDPNSIHEKQDSLPEGFDLRNFLRERALKHQQQTSQKENSINCEMNTLKNDQDIVYEQPITEPINIKNELMYHKFKGKYEYSRNCNNSSNNNSNNRNNNNNNKYHRSNHDKHNRYKNSKTNDNEVETKSNSNDDDDDDDDDSSTNCKKLRSVVAVISNSDNYQPSKDVQIVKSRSSSSNFYKRK